MLFINSTESKNNNAIYIYIYMWPYSILFYRNINTYVQLLLSVIIHDVPQGSKQRTKLVECSNVPAVQEKWVIDLSYRGESNDKMEPDTSFIMEHALIRFPYIFAQRHQ